MNRLSRSLVLSPAYQDHDRVEVPDASVFALPEKVLQFGTGAFLRGFVESFVDAANRQGRFGGRVVMVGSTGSGRSQTLAEQDGLYTLCEQGLEDGEPVDRCRVIASVSRALSAREAWGDVLACAHNPDLELIVSNTTEVGITLDEADRIDLDPPRSFPGKLTAFLYERARHFDYDPARGLLVLPCELLEDNGDALRGIVLDLVARWELGERFADWLREAVPFCNTLVDRIVPGTPEEPKRQELAARLGYEDGLLTVCEVYRLWAIEGDAALRARFPLAGVDPGLVIAEDVTPYRERKVRLLNGVHTIMVPAALLCGCDTVLDATRHPLVSAFLRRVMREELVPSLDVDHAAPFAHQVLDRFANPYVRHSLLGITLQGTMKMRVRVIPSIVRYIQKTGRVPASIAFGFACFLRFMVDRSLGRSETVPPRDDRADYFWALWQATGDGEPALRGLVEEVCRNEDLWGVRLEAWPGFVEAVTEALVGVTHRGASAALEAHLAKVECGTRSAE